MLGWFYMISPLPHITMTTLFPHPAKLIGLILVLAIGFPQLAISQQEKPPKPLIIMAKSVEKYDRASNGHYVVQMTTFSINAADTSRYTREGYYSRKKKGLMDHPFVQETTSKPGSWTVRKTKGDTLSYLGHESEKWEYELITNQDRSFSRRTEFGVIPFLYPLFFMGQLPPIGYSIKGKSAHEWIVKSGPYKVWIGKEDTLIHRIDYRGSKKTQFYKRIDILHQEFDRPEYDDLDLYRYIPYDSSQFVLQPPQERTRSQQIDPMEPGMALDLPPLPTTQGDTMALSDFRGKVVLLDFWYIGCKPCADAMPTLQQWHETYQNQGLVVIGLETLHRDADQINRFVERWGADYPQWYGQQVKELPILNQIIGYPTHFLIDREGKITEIVRGYSPAVMRKSERRIVELLEEPKG